MHGLLIETVEGGRMPYLVKMSLLNGITLAGLLFITASGLTLSFSLIRVVNLTHGALYLAGGFLGVSVVKATGNWLLAMLAGGGAMAVFAFLEERFLLRRARGDDLIETLVSLSVAIIIGDLVLVVWGGYPKSIDIPAVFSGAWKIPVIGMIYPKFRIIMLGLAALIALSVVVLFAQDQNGHHHPGRGGQLRDGLRHGGERPPAFHHGLLPFGLFGGHRGGGGRHRHHAGGGRGLAHSDPHPDRHHHRAAWAAWAGTIVGGPDHRRGLQLRHRLYLGIFPVRAFPPGGHHSFHKAPGAIWGKGLSL